MTRSVRGSPQPGPSRDTHDVFCRMSLASPRRIGRGDPRPDVETVRQSACSRSSCSRGGKMATAGGDDGRRPTPGHGGSSSPGLPPRPVPRRGRPARPPAPTMRGRRRQPPPSLAWALHNHRLVFAALVGAPGAVVLLSATAAAGTARTVQEQLGSVSVALVGMFLVGVAALALWGDQRRRETVRLADVEQYVAAVAVALGLHRARARTGDSSAAAAGGRGRAPARSATPDARRRPGPRVP